MEGKKKRHNAKNGYLQIKAAPTKEAKERRRKTMCEMASAFGKVDAQKMDVETMIEYLREELMRPEETAGEIIIDESEPDGTVADSDIEKSIYPYFFNIADETGDVEIVSLNKEKRIILHGAKEALYFAAILLKHYSR